MRSFDVKKPFGTSVRAWRGRLGISQEELAGRAGLHRTYISDVERGARNVSLESIDKLAHALEVSISTLLSRADEVFPKGAETALFSSESLVDILFVEDRDDDAEMAIRALKSAGIANKIHHVRDGAAALDFLFGTIGQTTRKTRKNPQLILLDLNLPKVDGLEVLRRVKADARTRDIPVIVLTVSNRDRDIASSKQLGAAGYIVKPVDFQNLSKVTPQLSLHWALLRPAVA